MADGLPVLGELLDAPVVSLAHIEYALGVHGDAVGLAQLADSHTQAPKFLDVVAVLVVVDHPIVAVPIADKDVTRWRNGDIRGAVEMGLIVAGFVGRAKCQKQFAVLGEFAHQMAPEICGPDAAFMVDPEIVGSLE